MFAQIASYMRERKWQEAIELSEKLILIDGLYFDRLKQNLEEAYTSIIRNSVRFGELNEAQEWLNRANSYLGDSAQLSILYSRIQYKLGNIKEARASLKQVIMSNPERSDSILAELRKIVHAELNRFNRSEFDEHKIALLSEEIEFDPNYPIYHYLLGKLYFRNGDYEASVERLYRAVYLDSSYEDELLPIINTAQEKSNLPDLIEVPFTATGKTIHVDVHLNNSAAPFHFVLDTGASYTSISKAVADQLGLGFQGNAITLNTANGQITAPVINMESVTLNGATVYNVQTVVLNNLDNIDGLLGLNFLSHFNMDMDQTNGKIGLSRR
jgi:clan AA aspartic protease (TIGR02281 family)